MAAKKENLQIHRGILYLLSKWLTSDPNDWSYLKHYHISMDGNLRGGSELLLESNATCFLSLLPNLLYCKICLTNRMFCLFQVFFVIGKVFSIASILSSKTFYFFHVFHILEMQGASRLNTSLNSLEPRDHYLSSCRKSYLEWRQVYKANLCHCVVVPSWRNNLRWGWSSIRLSCWTLEAQRPPSWKTAKSK